MASNIDNLNFKVILDDKDFNTRVEKDIELAKKLNVELSQLLQAKVKVNAISATEAASAKRASDILTKQATNQEKISQAKAKTAEAEEKVATQAAKTAKEFERAKTATSQTAVNVQRLATEQQRTAAATQNAAAATSRAALAQRRLRDYASQTTNTIRTQNRLMSELKGYALGYLSIHGATQLLSSLVRVTGEFELQKTTLAAMLGDLNEAEQIITRIQGLAVESPFQFKELTTYAKQLSAFSVPAEELYETTKMLADVSAGLGVGMDRIVLAYGQVRSAAFLRGQEVRQFTEAGIPILDELAKQFTELEGRAVSTGEVFDKISARLVPFEMVAKVFKDMTSEGGKFYNMQEVQAETLRGKISNLKDAYEMMLNEIGSQKSGAMKNAVDSLRSLMQNWERVGAILKTVIISYGVYKATLASVWAYEKLMAGVEMYKRWQRMNQLLLATTGNTQKLATAMRILGISAKGAAGVAIAAIAGIVTIIARAISNASKLQNELDSIMTTKMAESDKAVAGLNRLVDNLKKATQGSQKYRDIISELNRQYGEYLPKILSEADAYDQVRIAADAAAEAIRNKAKANAFEQGSAAIEEDFGKRLTKSTTSLRDALTNMYDTKGKQISKEIASEFIKNFNVALAQEGAMDDIEATIKKAFDNYFGEGKFEEYKLNFALGTFEFSAKEYAKVRSEVIAAEKDLQSDLDARFGDAQFSSLREREKIAEVEAWYRKEEDALKKLTLTQAEYNKKIQELDINKLRKLVTAYEEMGRSDVAAAYQKQIDALTKIPEGWRGKVQSVLKGMGLTKGNSFGLWAEDTTQSTAYVDEMIKRYKELKEEIEWVKTFDPKQAERLKKEKNAIEAVSKALKIDIANLSANKSDTIESKEEKRIKRLVDALRTLQGQYEKLKALGASDESIKTLFEGLYPDLIKENGKDFVTDLNYLERAKGLIEELAKLDPSDAKKLLVDIGEDEFGAYLKNLEKQNKAYKESAKAAGEYFNALRKWASEDFNINGEGIVLDVSKIASDLNEKIDEIELRATKAKEIFEQIDINSEEEISKVKELFVKEFGADAWEQFWDAYYTEGVAAIDALAEKQAQYERVLSQEKVNDLAEKYVKESYFTEGIKLTDLGDKTIFQLRDLKKKLQNMLNKEPLSIPAEIETRLADVGVSLDDLTNVSLDVIFEAFEHSGEPIDETTKSIIALIKQIQQAGLSTKDFGKVIRKVFEGDLQELTEEEGKLLADMVMQYMDQLESLFKSIGEFAESTGNESLQSAAKGISEVLDVLGPMADKFAKGDWIGGIISGVTSLATKIFNVVAAQHELAKAIEETANQQRILNAEYAIMEGVEGAFGENTFKKFTNAYQEATKAYKDVQEDLERQNKVIFGGENNDANGWGIGGGIGAGAALGAAIGSIFPVIGTAIGAGIGALIGAFVGGITDVALEADNYAKSLKEMAEEIGAPLINEKTGGYNLETLKTIKETYKNLSEEDAAWLDQAIANTEIYEKALTAMADYMSSVFGSVADDMADAFITSFKESGQAALDYADIMDGVASQIAKDIIKSTLLQNVFTDELTEDAAKKLASGDTAGAMAIVDEAMKSAAALAPYIQEFLEQIEPYFQMEEEKPENTLGSGIKGITEDTANLLASYLNAIRADVSYAKTLWERMDANTQSIAAALAGFSAPSLMEYQAQIAANTYNTSISTQNILIELRSVMGFGDEGRAIRILS